MRKLGLSFVNLVVIILIICAVGFGYIYHLKYHLTTINDTQPITWLRPTNVPHIHHYHADVIFYRDTCQHCQRVIPYVYLYNRLSGKHIEYRDLNTNSNESLADSLNGSQDFPDARKVSLKQGKLSIHATSLWQTTKFRAIFYATIVAFTIILLSILLAIVFDI